MLEAERAGLDGLGGADSTAVRSRLDQLTADWRTHLPSVAVLVAAAWWLLVVTGCWGGRDIHTPDGWGGWVIYPVTVGALLTALAVVAIRPDRLLPRNAVLLALAVSVGAMLVAATAPTGWAGAANGADYVCAAWTMLCVAAAIVRDRAVVVPLLGVVVAGVGLEMRESWTAWWGSADSTTPIVGTFYWHNPFAIYLLPGAGVGLAVFLRRTGLVAFAGLAGFVLGAIGVFYSTSRGTLACFVALVVLILAGHLVATRTKKLVRAVGGLAATAAVVWLIGGPPFFPDHPHSPVAGVEARAQAQSLGQNGGYRVDFWREALGVFSRHPVTGGGYHSLSTASVGHNPHHWPLSPLAHNGYLQALTDGGLVLGVPFLLACCVVTWWVLDGLWSSVRRRNFGVMSFAVPLTLGALLAHSAIDFDWSYPADFVLTAIFAGLVAGERWSVRKRPPGGTRWPATLGAVVGVCLLVVAAVAARSGDLRQNLPITSAHGAPPLGVQK